MLDSLEIKNFRSCEDVRLVLGEPVIALLGKNGVGKTNVLHAIQLAADLCVGESESFFGLHPRDSKQPTSLVLRFSIGPSRYVYRTIRSALVAKSEDFEESLERDNTTLFRRKGEHTEVPNAGLPTGVRFGTRAATLPSLLQILPQDNSLNVELKPVADYLRSVRYYSLLQGFQEHLAPSARAFSFGDASGDSSPIIEVARYETWKAELAQGRGKRSVQMRLLHLWKTDKPSYEELKTLLGDL